MSPSDRAACTPELRKVGIDSLRTGRLGRLAETRYAWEAIALATWDEQRDHERWGQLTEAPVELVRPFKAELVR